MVAILNVARGVRPMVVAVFVACVVFYYLLCDVDYPLRKPSLFGGLPAFPSAPYVQVVAEKESSPLHGVRWPYRVFKSSPFTPPHLEYYEGGGEVAKGYLVFTPQGHGEDGLKQSFPLVMTQDNELVYCLDEPGESHNLRVQTIHGKPHLTVWNGKTAQGHGFGNVIVMDQEYRRSTIRLNETMQVLQGDDFHPSGNIDFHEQEVTNRGTIIVTAFNTVPDNLTDVNGPAEGFIDDSMLYEIDIKTGQVVWQWSAYDTFRMHLSRLRLPNYLADGTAGRPHDFFHLDSVQAVDDDSILVSARNWWSVFLISRASGQVIWELNGSGDRVGSFGRVPIEAQFRWQHGARLHNVTSKKFRLSLYDNHNSPDDSGKVSSRGLVLEASLPPNSSIPPTLIRDMEPVEELFAEGHGSFEVLPNGNQLLGHGGAVPVIREYGPSGDSSDLRWEGRFGHNGHARSYRVYKSEWHATPKQWSPSLVLEKDEATKRLQAYVSWNGATDVEAWTVYKVRRGEGMEALGRARKRGFETQIDVPEKFNDTQCVLVAAVQGGEEVAQSNMACLFVNI